MAKVEVIVLNGSGGVGKDTFYHMCDEYIKNNDIGITFHTSMVELTKILATRAGWNGEKDPVSRKFLSDIKDLIDKYNDSSYRYVSKAIEMVKKSPAPEGMIDFVFIDAREPKDIERLVKDFNATTVLIINDNVPQVTSNHADMEVQKYYYDYYIDNSGTLAELRNKAIKFMEGKYGI